MNLRSETGGLLRVNNLAPAAQDTGATRSPAEPQGCLAGRRRTLVRSTIAVHEPGIRYDSPRLGKRQTFYAELRQKLQRTGSAKLSKDRNKKAIELLPGRLPLYPTAADTPNGA